MRAGTGAARAPPAGRWPRPAGRIPPARARQVDSKYFTAVETAASNQLFQVVVDTDDTAARMLRELQQANAGRVTFMPLNRLRPGRDPEYPVSDDVIPMINKLKFDAKLRPAFAQVFRKTLLVVNLEVARHTQLGACSLAHAARHRTPGAARRTLPQTRRFLGPDHGTMFRRVQSRACPIALARERLDV